MHSGGLELALVLMLAAIVAVPVFKRFGLGAVLAYLVAGVVLGPDGVGVVQDAERISGAAEIGVVMLLFVIGLELSPALLKVMRHSVFGAGATQVLVTAVILGGLLMAARLGWKSALIVGVALALSSTAVGLQLLAERKALNSDYGRLAFAILLFQDLIAIPLLASIPLLGGSKNDALEWQDVAKAIAALALVIVCGRFVLRHLFNVVARTRMPEVFTASALLVVLGTAWIMQEAGLGASLGAFIAGVLLADSEFRHELESQIEPFEGLLLGLFFISVGMGIDLHRVVAEPWVIAAGVAILLVVKFSLLVGIGSVAKLPLRSSLMLGSVLWLGGEFAFVVFNEADRVGLLEPANHDRLVAIVGVSMALTPLLLLGMQRILNRPLRVRVPKTDRPFDTIDAQTPKVLVAGMGRFGQVVARLLTSRHVPFVALEHNPHTVEDLRRFGSQLYYGDPTRPELLRAAGADRIKVFVIAVDDPESNIKTVRLIRRLYPQATVLARARNRQHAWKLMDLGAEPFREVFASSLELSERVLTSLGLGEALAHDHVKRFRQHDEDLLRRQHLVYDDEAKVIQTSRDARADLMNLFEADVKADVDGDDQTVAATREK
ncbi:monovalent cation:proton antiporter-2 (CPA2) family protein [Xanthomonas oryzae]|uniref:Glutathione-regulated potassium-efflux system protein n=1 Tax=Xanthomonas oryzae pv. oryzae (strain KACC10331 / KXO85) TaxID=291331 RepID=Q5H5P7_XANOR|nr:monovalent cation:proton antiporter-2 (CPA2) family protein [Xanthomonas oryzae]AAW73723.1 glutathione-regulated potassium-efflux system protein [Xanthomonas oryzae pv. oryzae KACC 10331]AXM19737.1 glutathione-regulated potassium-efflux system protein KefB [Xanthomonas oryzae pv. oryzae]QBN93384.1 glutathione-regulated potassium-efflux system protein KefB [Xanthomonas oryzae pv. oryzae]QBN97276.1 glutathione-regulated potassium-efflux system protein KefB [Xanthomonas oryzae pv. oryzae]QIF22